MCKTRRDNKLLCLPFNKNNESYNILLPKFKISFYHVQAIEMKICIDISFLINLIYIKHLGMFIKYQKKSYAK